MDSRKQRKVTLLRLAGHDFSRSLRVWSRYHSVEKIFGYLVEQRSRSLRVFLQSFALSLIGTIWLQTGKDDLAAKFERLEISVPSIYIAFAVSMIFSSCITQLINYFMLNEFIRIASNKLFKFDNSSALSILLDGQNAWTLPLWYQYRFFRSKAGHASLIRIASIILIFPFILLGGFILWSYVSISWDIINKREVYSVSAFLCFAGAVVMIFPILYASVLRVPMSFRRNPMYIRWLFLYRIYKRDGNIPAHVAVWVKNSKL